MSVILTISVERILTTCKLTMQRRTDGRCDIMTLQPSFVAIYGAEMQFYNFSMTHVIILVSGACLVDSGPLGCFVSQSIGGSSKLYPLPCHRATSWFGHGNEAALLRLFRMAQTLKPFRDR